MNNLPNNTKTTPSSDMIKQISDALNDNSTVAIVMTLTLGGCFVYKTYIDAKHNRETKLSYEQCSTFSHNIINISRITEWVIKGC